MITPITNFEADRLRRALSTATSLMVGNLNEETWTQFLTAQQEWARFSATVQVGQ